MKVSEILPERWEEIAYRRRIKYKDDEIVNFITNRNMLETCQGCPAFRFIERGEWIYMWCILDKCIKQYPHIKDNREFK